jgi:hypothetical protein
MLLSPPVSERAIARRFRVAGFAEATLFAYAEEAWPEDPDLDAACAAFRAGGRIALLVEPGSARAVVAGLHRLANTEDEIAEEERRWHPARRDADRARMARAAASGLSTLALRVARAWPDRA